MLSNPKFAQSQPRDTANFGFGTRGRFCTDRSYPAHDARSDVTHTDLIVPSPYDLAGACRTDAGLERELARAKEDV